MYSNKNVLQTKSANVKPLQVQVCRIFTFNVLRLQVNFFYLYANCKRGQHWDLELELVGVNVCSTSGLVHGLGTSGQKIRRRTFKKMCTFHETNRCSVIVTFLSNIVK